MPQQSRSWRYAAPAVRDSSWWRCGLGFHGGILDNKSSKLLVVLYRLFVVTGAIGVGLALVVIWGLAEDPRTVIFLSRVMGTCLVLAVTSAFAMSASQLVGSRRS